VIDNILDWSLLIEASFINGFLGEARLDDIKLA
jgi:hypothetical protein